MRRWRPAGFADAHFATFPEWLVEPLVKAGTSEKGCCPECGKPWVRVMVPTRPSNDMRDMGGKALAQEKGARARRLAARTQAARDRGEDHDNPLGGVKTLAWRPACKCRADSVPCTVLDPFSGAGTVALVAARLGRRAVGIEAKADYNAMALKRIGQGLAPATFVDESIADAAPLFTQEAPHA